MSYFNEIKFNKSAFNYYKDAYNFTKWITGSTTDKVDFDGDGNADSNCVNLTNLTATPTHIKSATTYEGYQFEDVGKIFSGTIQNSNSNFNRHRADVIRGIITTNLSRSIAGFSRYAKNNETFIMPKISPTDWETLENNICMVTFMQGINFADKRYNSYAVVANNCNKEYVDENDIYILKKAIAPSTDRTYAKANDNSLNDSTILAKSSTGRQPGVIKIDFERKLFKEGQYFIPMSYKYGSRFEPYLESYSSIAGTTQINSIDTIDMYRYMSNKVSSTALKRAYYTALGRERQGSFKFTIYTDMNT